MSDFNPNYRAPAALFFNKDFGDTLAEKSMHTHFGNELINALIIAPKEEQLVLWRVIVASKVAFEEYDDNNDLITLRPTAENMEEFLVFIQEII